MEYTHPIIVSTSQLNSQFGSSVITAECVVYSAVQASFVWQNSGNAVVAPHFIIMDPNFMIVC